MPAITLHPLQRDRSCDGHNPLPQLLRTPSGLAVLEIQGTVNSTFAAESDSISLGQLIFPQYDPAGPLEDTSWHKRVYLYVGKHQRLTGEVKKLSKPLAVVRRRATEISAGASLETEELEITEIVYYKLLFAQRPEPVGQGKGV
ncbi:hypothetical protein M433DRAFT_60290 [Acidomyces richmondensis BFW]|nr:MAG: hypothetical protein FE78DRAFT_287341 [Acidomyces sp. 'richmondensis']KYG48851.1 hypothetical protein M433DRAFT_60290 [Acidomyces richmondensis BFW]